ncbi:MAG: toxin [Thermoanaerobaculia bacterium]|nr:toxin [Thermoanaerobaculia bacterium]MBP9822608.1 toxin [Thermoanaerobaculia bacterium]
MAKGFGWGTEKNLQLKKERGITFEEILFHIERGDLLDVLEHPHPERFAQQRIFVVRVVDYVYLVPFVESETELFLKTIIPSRKATRDYLRSEGEKP